MEIPFIGPTYNLESRPSGVQRTINLIPHPQEPGNERTGWVFKDVPGLVLVQDFSGSQEAGDWLGYDTDGFGPSMVDGDSTGAFQPLGTPVPFEVGVSMFNSDFVSGSPTVHIPLFGGTPTAPTLVEDVTWFPENPGDPAPTITATNPSGGVWSGYTWVIEFASSGYVSLIGPTGMTVITITIGGPPFFYSGSSLEYQEL
jgi:hypothetical protein